MEIEHILITHYHPDHLGGSMAGMTIEGAARMLERVKAKVYVNKAEAEGIPRGTKMFQFPRFPLPGLCVQLGVSRYDPDELAIWVSPA